MELTEEEKATLYMLNMTPEDYQQQFSDSNRSGQKVNFAGQTLDDYFISMLDKDSEFELRSDPELRTWQEEEGRIENELTKQGVGLGSVQPKTIDPTKKADEITTSLADSLKLVQGYQQEFLQEYQAGLEAYRSGRPMSHTEKYEMLPRATFPKYQKIEEREFEEFKKLRFHNLEEEEKDNK